MNAIDIHAQGARHRRGSWSSATSGCIRLARAAIWTAAMLVCLAIPSLARAANHEWCVRYKYDSPDRAYGDFGTGQYWISRGIRVGVNTTSGTATVVASSETGCFSFTSNQTSGMFATVYLDATIGPLSHTVRIPLVIGGSTPAIVFAGINPTLDPYSGKYRATITVDSSSGWEESLSSVAYTMDRVLKSGNHDGSMPSIYAIYRGGYGDQNNASASSYHMNAGDPLRREKYLMAHEAGHALSYYIGNPVWLGASADYNFFDSQWQSLSHLCMWDENSSDDSNVSGHAMRSQETSRGAGSEGFAHFISAITWNNRTYSSGEFKYYKTMLQWWYNSETYSLGSNDTWPIAWTHDDSIGCDCGAPIRANCSGSGSEIDWLRALWSWGSGSGTRPTLVEIFKVHDLASRDCGPFKGSNFGSRFTAAAWHLNSTQGFRWSVMSSPHLVDTTPIGDEASCQ